MGEFRCICWCVLVHTNQGGRGRGNTAQTPTSEPVGKRSPPDGNTTRRPFFLPIFFEMLVRFCAYRIIKIAVRFGRGHPYRGAFPCIIPILHQTRCKKRWCVFVRIVAMAELNALLVFKLFGAFVRKYPCRPRHTRAGGPTDATLTTKKKQPFLNQYKGVLTNTHVYI